MQSMQTKIETDKDQRAAWLWEELLVIVAAGTLALIIGLSEGLSVADCIILVLGAAVFAGGITYTFLEVRRLGRRGNGRNVAEAEQEAIFRASRAARLKALAKWRKLVRPRSGIDEACPHHEYFPESPGQDQGQLTSSLPVSTPLLEHFAESSRDRKAPRPKKH